MNALATIIINNYNYDRFLREAIDSALAQTYSPLEVIVVDDGSTDTSREIIKSYGEKIIPVLKENGGQASAFNAGFKISSGGIIIFLDSDDILYPNAVENAVECFQSKSVAKAHWPLDIINKNGVKTGEITPKRKLPAGDFKSHALTSAPPFFLNPPTTGNAWSREFIQSVMPIPEVEFRIGADTYLFETVPFFGLVKRIDQPQGAYRVHNRNNYNNQSFRNKLDSEVKFYETLFDTLTSYCKKLGLIPNTKLWREKSWFHEIMRAIQDIKKVVPENTAMILVDEGTWDMGSDLDGRRVYSFLEKNGTYVGVPQDDEQGISELELMSSEKGIRYLVFVWSSFWWFNEYKRMSKYLFDNFPCICKNDRIIVFDLNKKND